MTEFSNDFFSEIFEQLRIADTLELSSDEERSVRENGAFFEERPDSFTNTMYLLSALATGRLSGSLGAFFLVAPVKEAAERAISAINRRYPDLLTSSKFADAAASIFNDDDGDTQSTEDDPGEPVREIDATIGIAAIAAPPMIMVTADEKPFPAFHLKIRDESKAVILDRAMPIMDAVFLAGSLLEAINDSLRLYSKLVVGEERWPMALNGAVKSGVEELSRAMAEVVSTAGMIPEPEHTELQNQYPEAASRPHSLRTHPISR